MSDWRKGGNNNLVDVSSLSQNLSNLSLDTPNSQPAGLKTTHSSEKYLVLNNLYNLKDEGLIRDETLISCKEKVLESALFDFSSVAKFGPPQWVNLVENTYSVVDINNYSQFLQSLASLSNLPWRTVLTANVLLQRHCYIMNSEEDDLIRRPSGFFEGMDISSRILLITSCLLIASKVEESLCRLSNLLYSLRSLLGDAVYIGMIPNDRVRRGSVSRDPEEAMSKAIKITECHLLATLGFDIEVEHPHYVIRLLHLIALPTIELLSDESKMIIKFALSLLDKSQMDIKQPTSLFFQPATMSLAALYLSWFNYFGSKEEVQFNWDGFLISPQFRDDMFDFIHELLSNSNDKIENWECKFVAPKSNNNNCSSGEEIVRSKRREYHEGKCRNVESYQKIEAICEGTYGTVWVAKEKRTRERVALKQLKNTIGSNGFPYYMMREILFLRRLKHPNVVSGQEVLTYQHSSGEYEFYIVMEYISFDLRDIWLAQRERTAYPLWNESNVKDLSLQLLSAISYMHNRGLMHRDIKLENILFDEGVLKVADLGSIRDAGRTELKLTTAVVTLWYRPPELLLGNTVYTNSIDIWSIGCVLVELLAMQALFPGKDVDDMMRRIIRCLGAPTEEETEKFFLPLPQGPKFVNSLPSIRQERTIEQILQKYSPSCWDLIHRMLQYDPEKRISADEALLHPYFTESPLPSKYIPQ